ncbi:MAG TPA: hypothetical protein VGN20_02920 [Mucilaginibacter sp.]
MKYIAKNEDLLSFLSEDKSIIDATITRFDIYNADNRLNIDVYITLLYSKSDKELKLRFKDVLQYCMFYTRDHNFYYIERYKLFKCDEGFYVSFDPFDENLEIQSEDNDFILSSEVEGYFLDK